MPQLPLDPNYEDCNRLAREPQQQLNDLYKARVTCMATNAPSFGHCAGSGESTAWVQCCSIDAQQRRLSELLVAWRNQCSEMANARRTRESRDRAANSDRERKDAELAKSMKAGNDLYEKFRVAASTLSRPEVFLRQALTPNSAVYRQLFSNEGKLTNPSLGQEMYRYSFNQARAGVDAQRGYTSSIIRAIQSEALRSLQKQYDGLFLELDTTLDQMTQLGAGADRSIASQLPTSQRTYAPPISGDRDRECGVLSDPLESRKLMETDSTKWLELTRICTR